MLLAILEMAWYSVAFFIAGVWLLSRLAPNGVKGAPGRAIGIAWIIACLAIGYVMAFEKTIEPDCRPAGPSIFNDC